MRTKAILLALAATLSLGSTSANAQVQGPATTGWREPDPENVLVIDTNKGRVIAELTPQMAPPNGPACWFAIRPRRSSLA